MSAPITVILADDHAMLRTTLANCLDGAPDMKVLASVGDADTALTEALKHKPDVLVLDIDMPGLVSFDAARTVRARCPQTRIIFLSAFFHDRYIERALAVEASGYVTKNEPPASLIQAIRSAISGASYYSPQVLSRIVITPEGAMLPADRRSRASALTQRELEVLRYLTRGLAKKEIANVMHISVNTVNRHSDSLMSKLDIHDRVQLAGFAIREGLAEP